MIKNICCIGAGFVGGPTMSVFADKCPNLNITVVDINNERIDSWNSENLQDLPIFEPGLADLVKKNRNKNLFFSSNISQSISEADIVFISVNTPIKKTGVGAGEASDLKWVEASARTIAEFAIGHTIVVEKSTLPVRTAQVIKEILDNNQGSKSTEESNKTFSVLSNPEFLAEGTALNDLENPDRVLIGGEDRQSIEVLRNLYLNWVPKEKIISASLWSSELSKLTANAFLAQRISSINSISAVCEVIGGDINQVAKAVGLDSRIGEKFLNSGPGFGGSCFKKDILNLVYLCKYFNLPEVANYWDQVIKLNQWQKERIYKKIVEKLFGNLSDKRIAILGFAFKANTNDTRESPAIQISKDLLDEGAKLVFYDPKVTPMQIKNDLIGMNDLNQIKDIQNNKYEKNLYFTNSVYDAVKGIDAIIILTEWDEFRTLNWLKIADLMRSPSWLFDTRGIVNPSDISHTSINLWKLGNAEFN